MNYGYSMLLGWIGIERSSFPSLLNLFCTLFGRKGIVGLSVGFVGHSGGLRIFGSRPSIFVQGLSSLPSTTLENSLIF